MKWLIGYLLAGVFVLLCCLSSTEVRNDAKTMEPGDLLGFMVFMILTWPSLVFEAL